MTLSPRVLIVALLAALLVVTFTPRAGGANSVTTYQGKTIQWWAKHAVQARKDANARGRTIKRLRRTLAHDPSVQESIMLAHLVYPDLSVTRAWRIIKHESWMVPDPLHAYNRTAVNGCHATGLYQFLDCTFRSTPFGKMSIYSPYAQSLAAGWMHAHHRGCEWDIAPDC